jgi:hypothetical protein
LGITAELKITSQAADFIKQILSFSAYGGSCVVKTLNQTSLHMRGWLDLKLRYWPGWVGFLQTLVINVVPFLTNRRSRK